MVASPIHIISINLNKSQPATENALQIAVESKADLILVQEPYLNGPSRNRDDWSNATSTIHSSYTQIFPRHDSGLRPRTVTYVSRTFRPTVSLSTNSPSDPDIQILEISDKHSKLQVINIYNQDDQGNTDRKTFRRCLTDCQTHADLIVAGDFNSHHPWWNPDVVRTGEEAEAIVDWLESKNLDLLNKPGDYTFWRANLNAPTILDLAFASPRIRERCDSFNVNRAISSDHYGLQFTVRGIVSNSERVDNPTQQIKYNTKLADWDKFASTLQQHAQSSRELNSPDFDRHLVSDENSRYIIQESIPTLTALLDATAKALTDIITKAAEEAIPKAAHGARAKSWWTSELKEIRKDMLSKQRRIKMDNLETKRTYLTAKNKYFQAIKTAKRDHWNAFLEKEDPQSIFRAMKYTQDSRIQRIPNVKNTANIPQSSFEGKCAAFKEALFPPPPIADRPSWRNYQPNKTKWQWPPLTKTELDSVCSMQIKSKSPGPDGITQEIIAKAYNAIPNTFFHVYSILIDVGYHPSCWKMATGAILQKNGKSDYSIPKSYRIITLLNCLGKVAERIIAKRLSHLAETTNLIHKTQLGGRLKKSAVDAALLLTNFVERNKKRKWKTTTLFMDVKGAYDHVARFRLYKILQELELPLYLIAWVSTFLINRLLRIAFDGEVQEFAQIISGVPQGSPVSPILFLIYIRDLFKSSAVTWISYVDDVSLSTASTSLERNVALLEKEAQKLYQLADVNKIAFDLEKTELIHWTASHNAIDLALKLPNDVVVKPKQSIKWLGIYFDPNLSFKQHVAIKIAKAKGAFFRMTRLANIERGLTPFALRQLYIACVTSIADYGSVIWWRGQQHFKKLFQGLQNLAIRKILGTFKTAPILPMEVEAALPPPEVRLNASIRGYAFRLLKLSPSHPINEATNHIISPTEPPQRSQNKTQLQLHRIHESITEFYCKPSLEKIQHHHFPPWDRETYYDVKISKLSKDDEAKAHTDTLKSNTRNNVFIYTDASATKTRETTGIGIGLAVLSPPSKTVHFQKQVNIGDGQLVYNGELEGATQAVEYAERAAKSGLKFHVYSDNQAGLWRLLSPSDNPGQECQIRAIKAARSIRSKGADITLHWVPGHTKIDGNETADQLAKSATLISPSLNQTSFAMVGVKIKQQNNLEWRQILEKNKARSRHHTPYYSYRKHFAWIIRSKLRAPSGTPREVASAFYQLKLGHGYIKAYLHRFNHASNARCRCGRIETTEHLLLTCPEVGDARKALKDKLKRDLTLQTLLHTTDGVEATLDFLKMTKIATRKWHLSRVDDGGGEGSE